MLKCFSICGFAHLWPLVKYVDAKHNVDAYISKVCVSIVKCQHCLWTKPACAVISFAVISSSCSTSCLSTWASEFAFCTTDKGTLLTYYATCSSSLLVEIILTSNLGNPIDYNALQLVVRKANVTNWFFPYIPPFAKIFKKDKNTYTFYLLLKTIVAKIYKYILRICISFLKII